MGCLMCVCVAKNLRKLKEKLFVKSNSKKTANF